jgi:DNA helicase-2/ATP-dependent DNA helicase PcrA
MTFVPSPQQQDVFDAIQHGRRSLRIDAVAGAGKTTTIIEAVKLMTGSVAFTAYNKKIAQEIEERLKANGAGPNVKAGTFHSFGFNALRRAFPKTKLDDKKLFKLCDRLGVPELLQEFVRKAVSLAKQRAIGILCSYDDHRAWFDLVAHFELEEALVTDGIAPTVPTATLIHEGLQWAQQVLKISIEQDPELIDFDDMIYAPLVHDVKMWGNDWVLVDEAQDTNPARRALAKKMLKPGGRLVAVGDPRQAIYGFTGADADALDLIEEEFSCLRLPLTVTYRCPKAVVAHAQNWVDHIEAHACAPEGEVCTVDEAAFWAGTWSTSGTASITPHDVILCRNTKPLVELAYKFIRRNVAVHVEGKDIGMGLLALTRKWRVNTVNGLRDRLTTYLAKEQERLLAAGQETKAAALADRVETLFVIAEQLPDNGMVTELQQKINALFQDTPEGTRAQTLTLSTVHKAKGREWDRVFLWGRNRYMPSPYARQEWQQEQEDNLIYVAVTRAKQTLIEVVVPVKPKGGDR